jgi:hypothetical protein
MSVQSLSFYFAVQDPSFTSDTVVLTDIPNYIAHAFVKTDIFDSSTNERIGYKVSDDYVQQVEDNKFIVRLNNTYYFDNGSNGSINWMYSFISDKNQIYYPVDVPVQTNIVSTTGDYYGKTGNILLIPLANGMRNVTITFA